MLAWTIVHTELEVHMMDVVKAIEERHSVRGFTGEEVPTDIITETLPALSFIQRPRYDMSYCIAYATLASD